MTTCLPFSKAEIKGSLVTRFERVVRQFPEQIALKSEQQALTYRALNEASNRLARAILARQEQTPLGLLFGHEADAIVGILGALKARQIFVPLSPEFPLTRLRYMVEDTQARLIVTNSQNLSQARDLVPNTEQILNLDEGYQSISNEVLASSIPHDTPACIFYTSGSTGQAKGVVWAHSYVLHYVWQNCTDIQIGVSDRHSLLFPFNVGASMSDIFSPLLNGATLCLFNPRQKTLTELKSWLQQEKITFFHPPVALFRRFMDHLTFDADFPQLRAVILGGDVLRRNDVARFRKLFTAQGSQSRACLLVNRLAGTEMGLVARLNIDHATEISTPVVPVGYPVAEKDVLILNQSSQEVFDGVGEIAIRSAYLSLGYWRKPELTQAKFLPDPEGSNKQIYLTGDLGRMRADGMLEHLGRKDFMVKIRGYRVELGAIESTLLELEGIKEAVVVAQEKPNGNKQLVAYVVPSTQNVPAVAPTVSALRLHLAQTLPDYMIPSLFIYLDAFPLMPTGKVNRRALPEPGNHRPELEKPFVPPHTPWQETLADIWAEVLGLERVGIHDHFLDLGGHSLHATQIISRLFKRSRVELTLRTLFEAPTVAKLAQMIVQDQAQIMSDGCHDKPIILPRKRPEHCPLSFAQQRLWFLNQLEPNSAVVNMPKVLRIQGELNSKALLLALNLLVERHESLRTVFPAIDGQPKQVILESKRVELPVMALSSIPASERELEVQRLLHQETSRPFNLTSDLMVRACLLRLEPQEHILLLVMHHIACDDWSTGILLRELSLLYEAALTGQPAPLPALPLQYADFTLWQRDWLQGARLEEQLAYWRQQLGENLPLLMLPTDRSYPAIPTYRGRQAPFCLPHSLSEALKRFSQQEGVTLFMTLLTAFKVLLMRYSGQEQIIVGTPIANRKRAEIEGLIGFFVNTLALKSNLSGNPSVRELLAQVRQVTLAAYDQQDLPFEKLVEELALERDLSRHPLFQVMFVLHNSPKADLRAGLSVSQLDFDKGAAQFDLLLNMKETSEGLKGFLLYRSDLFDPATIGRMLGHFETLLQAIVINPEQQIWDLPLLTAAERHQLLVEWNDTATDYPRDKCIHELFEAQVEKTPDAVAVVYEGQQLSYRELNARANQLAHHLIKLGVGPEKLVGICLQRSLEMIIGLLAILKAGGAYVPLNPQLPKERLLFMLEDAKVQVLVTSQDLVATYMDTHLSEGSLVLIEQISAQSKENPVSGVTPQNLAYLIYTSGSTGKPKGVLIEHQGLCNLTLFDIQSLEVKPSDRVLHLLSFSFDAATIIMFRALCSGALLYIASKNSILHPATLIQLLEDKAITNLSISASLLATLPEASLPALKVITAGAEACCAELVARWRPKEGGRRFFNIYGPTETTIRATMGECFDGKQKPPIGSPIANTQAYILDQNLQPVPIGVVGELHIGGVGLARGYLNRPILSAQKFIANPFGEGRLYKTGDLVRYLPDGNIDFLGRADNQVKIRGFRIELGEIEVALNSHPEVREAVVVADTSEHGDKQLVAYVVCKTPELLRAYLASKLPNYMLPAYFVRVDSLPLTPNGKIDRRALPEPDTRLATLEEPFAAPRSPIESQLADIWGELLNIEQVGIHDNFFALGGHSLLTVRLMMQISKQFEVSIPLSRFFEGPTIAQLASLLSPNEQTDAQAALRALPEGLGESISELYDSVGVPGTLSGHMPPHGGRRWYLTHHTLQRLPRRLRLTLARLLTRQPASSRLFRAQCQLIRQFLEIIETDAAADQEEALKSSLMYGFLHRYKVNMVPSQPEDHLDIQKIEQARAQNQGVLLLHSHVSCQFWWPRLELVGSHIGGVHHLVKKDDPDYDQITDMLFTRQLDYARETLQQGGVAQIAADGQHGKGVAREYDFHGRRRPFMTGFAELALATNAQVMPLIYTKDVTGDIIRRLGTPLDAGAGPHAERVERLVSQYVALLHQMWRDMPWLVPWYQMQRHLAYPPTHQPNTLLTR